jgi:signal transduction histidine kinase
LFLIVILSFLTAGVLLLFLIRSIKHRTSLKRKNEEIEKQKIELKKAKERAENSEALKDHFLKNISHEIRTPLNGIIGFSSIIAQPDITQTDKNNYQRIIDQNAKMLLSTIEDIIDIAKIKTQQVDIFKEKFDANQIIQEIQKLIHFEKDYLNKNEIEVIVEQNNKEKQIIYNDESKLRKVLVLLGNNAIKFTDKGHIKLGYYLKGSNIIFFIEDTGSGISQEDQQTIFETFRQAVRETNQTKDGIGIGLTIAKAFVEIMGGEIWFKSAINNGTTFYFSLPLKENNS